MVFIFLPVHRTIQSPFMKLLVKNSPLFQQLTNIINASYSMPFICCTNFQTETFPLLRLITWTDTLFLYGNTYGANVKKTKIHYQEYSLNVRNFQHRFLRNDYDQSNSHVISLVLISGAPLFYTDKIAGFLQCIPGIFSLFLK